VSSNWKTIHEDYSWSDWENRVVSSNWKTIHEDAAGIEKTLCDECNVAFYPRELGRETIVNIYDSAHVTWVKRAIEDYIATFPENREKDGEIRIVIHCEKTDADTFDCKIDCEEAHE